jgi:8-hydroxy-5-deazaflavin:NADPH oxidoreductase
MTHPMSSQTVGILGTGRMAVRLADQLVRNGHRVLLGSRTPERARQIADRLAPGSIAPATYEEALGAPFVLPAIFIRDGLFDLLQHRRQLLKGKTVIDILNPFNADYTDFILPWDTSAGEELARLLPDSSVVGIFKNIFWETFGHPQFPEGWSDVYVLGDDPAAKAAVTGLFPLSPFRFVDGGATRNSRVVERMTLFASELSRRQGFAPRLGWRFLGEPPVEGRVDPYAHLA